MVTETVMTNLALPNGSRITNAFDSVGRLTSTRLLTSGDSLLDSYAYIYNYAGQRTNLTRTDGSRVTNTYDNIGQLKSARGSGGYSTENLGYLYDTAWNLNKRTNNGSPTTFAVDAKNQLTSVGGLSCSYDNNGNLSSRVYDASGPKNYANTYDDENQLTSVATDTYYTPTGSRWKSTFTYDGRGRLRKRTDYTWYTGGSGGWYLSGEVRYLYDGMRVIQERNSGNTPTVAYTRGNDLSGSLEGAGGIGGLLARSHGYSGGAFSTHNCCHADGNGNVAYLVNSAEARAAEYRYDPYGNLRYTYDPLGNRYRFSSKEQMSNSGLYYYGYRFYDPNLQRWLNRDPLSDRGHLGRRSILAVLEGLSGEPNLYGFTRNNPPSLVDSDGRLIGLAGVAAWLAWQGICSHVARHKAEALFSDDKEVHCYTSCYHNRCTLLFQPIFTLLGGVIWEIGGGWDDDSFNDIVANAYGLVRSYDPTTSCANACRGCRQRLGL